MYNSISQFPRIDMLKILFRNKENGNHIIPMEHLEELRLDRILSNEDLIQDTAALLSHCNSLSAKLPILKRLKLSDINYILPFIQHCRTLEKITIMPQENVTITTSKLLEWDMERGKRQANAKK